MDADLKYKTYKLYVWSSILIVLIIAVFGYLAYAITTNEQIQTMILCTVVASVIGQIVGGIGTALYCLIDNQGERKNETKS